MRQAAPVSVRITNSISILAVPSVLWFSGQTLLYLVRAVGSNPDFQSITKYTDLERGTTDIEKFVSKLSTTVSSGKVTDS